MQLSIRREFSQGIFNILYYLYKIVINFNV